ncbi:MAG: hypothetical protein M1839_005480 [Geoglossum umbratile]|nr:MAG: hypothetical protein M1839_005480 [Geoglossum umbratile]
MAVLYDPIQADAAPVAGDIIALPGLGGHAIGSWKSPEGFDVVERLPTEVKNIRSIVYGYDTNLREANWKDTIYEMTESMLDSLQNIRDRGKPPNDFIGHSLGGPIIKQALIIVAENKGYKPCQDLLQSCCSVIFFGIPNEGIRFEELINMVGDKRSEELIRRLLPDKDAEMSAVLRALSRDLDAVKKSSDVVQKEVWMLCYYEKQETRISETGSGQPVSRLLVTKSSATYTGVSPKSYNLLPLNGDHRSMVKFRTVTDRGYESVRRRVQEFIEEAAGEWLLGSGGASTSLSIHSGLHSKTHVFTGDGEPTCELWNILKSVRAELNNLFVQTITAIPEAERQKTVKMMLWVLLAERPLAPTELHFALAFEFPYKSQKECKASQSFADDDEQMERLLRKRTRGLIEVTRTEQEWAPYRSPSLGKGAVGEGHGQLEKSCIYYVKIEEFVLSVGGDGSRLLKALMRSYPFLYCSVTSLFEHAAKAENGGVSQVHLLQHFQQPQDCEFKSWRDRSDLIEHSGYRETQGPQTVLLHLASQYGLSTCVEALLEQRVDANTKGGRFGTTLQAASAEGHDQIV